MASLSDLTAAEVRRAKLPPNKRQADFYHNLYQGRSLVLTVNAHSSKSGRKTWSVMFYAHGRPRRVKLGEWPSMDCRDARRAALEFDDQAHIAAPKSRTFKEVAEAFLVRHVQERQLISEREIRRHLSFYVFPKWANRPFLEIRRDAVNELLDHIVDNHGRAQADAVLATLRKLMRWHEGRDEMYRSPIVATMKRNIPMRRERWLTDEEIRNVWAAVGDMGAFAGLVRVLLLTGQRVGKVVEMMWEHIDVETGQWTIPRQKREKGVPYAITLPELALSIVADQPRVRGKGFVFSGRSARGRFNSFSQRKAELDAKLPRDMPHWTLHDLRRTARKLLTRAKVPVDVAELTLGHSLKGIRATYDDPAEYRGEIDESLRRIEAEIATILSVNPGVAEAL